MLSNSLFLLGVKCGLDIFVGVPVAVWHAACFGVGDDETHRFKTCCPDDAPGWASDSFVGFCIMSEVAATTTSASTLQMDFLNLLVTQLKNQDPMEPMDSENMSAQLAQFSELQQLEEMNGSFGQLLESIQRGYASSLIGKDVSFNADGADGSTEEQSGAVEEIIMQADGDIDLIIGDQTVSLADVLSVRE